MIVLGKLQTVVDQLAENQIPKTNPESQLRARAQHKSNIELV